MAGATQTRQRTQHSCPNCGADADPGQLVCLECGGRLGLDYRRPAGGKRAAAVVLVVLAAAGAAFALTLSSVDDEAEKEIAATPASKPSAGDAKMKDADAKKDESKAKEDTGADERVKERRERAAARRRAERRRAAQRRADRRRAAAGAGVAGWPRGRDGFMVVLLSTQDRDGARDFARTRQRAGVDGVLRADDYPSLSSSQGFYIVFAGPYPSRRKAEQAANRLQGRFSGVFVQFVDGSKKR